MPYSHCYYTENPAPSLRNRWSYNAANRQIDAYIHQNADWLETEFGGGADAPPPGGQEPEKKGFPVPEFLKKQRESFRETNLFSPEERDKMRLAPITVTLKMLEDFIRNGGFTFLGNAMHFSRVKKIDEPRPDIEPVRLSGLTRWGIVSNKLFPWLLKMGKNPDDIELEDLTELYRRLKAENAVPIGRDEELYIMELLDTAWIKEEELREKWKKQNDRGRRKQTLELDFSGRIPFLPETELSDLPGCLEDLDKFSSCYRNVKVVYETTRESGEPYIYLALTSSEEPKHKIRAWIRHLFFNACDSGGCETDLVWKKDKAGCFNSMGRSEARERLRVILTLYLYGLTHAVPFLCQCSTAVIKPKRRKPWTRKYSGRAEYRGERWETGDDQLDYAAMLWARNVKELEAQKDLCKVIEELAKKVLEEVLPWPQN